MRLLIIGQHGQLAHALAERCLNADIKAIRLGRPALDLAGSQKILPVLSSHPADIIINTAAYTAVDKAESEPELAHRINADGAEAVAAAAETLGVPLIHISTDYVFDGRKPEPYIETDPVCPINVYGESKLAGEDAVRAASSRHAILRTSWVFSPFGPNFVKTMIRLAQKQDEIRVVSDQIGSPTSALDLADAILLLAARLARSERGGFGTFHVVGSGTTSWAGLADCVFDACRRHNHPTARVVPIGSDAFPTAAARPANSRLDCSKLADVHGIRLRHFSGAVEETVHRVLTGSAGGSSAS
jgi:dTDP-4-dehydrorhamnose reductase